MFRSSASPSFKRDFIRAAHQQTIQAETTDRFFGYPPVQTGSLEREYRCYDFLDRRTDWFQEAVKYPQRMGQRVDGTLWRRGFSNSARRSFAHWVAIRRGARVCNAQWEDAGPFRTDHWQYVFGNERPLSNQNHDAGIDLSPAVRDFLNIGGMDSIDWRFVEFSDVPALPWTRLGDNNPFVQQIRSSTVVVRRDE